MSKISEDQAKQNMLLSLPKHVKMFRNNNGFYKKPEGGVVRYGLGNTANGKGGSPDYIGWVEKEITPDMVGKKIAIFCGIEVKSSSGTMQPNQKKWQKRLKDAGAIHKIYKGDKYVKIE